MKRVSILLIVVALIASMVGCPSDSGPEPPIQYDLTISSSGGGSVTSPGEGTFAYDEEESVLLVAEADEGYRFVSWTGNVDTIANVNAAGTTISMNGDYGITANFEAIPPARYTLTISSAAGGSVTVPGEGSFAYDEGTMVDLVAEAEEGYVFVGWTGDVIGVADIDAVSTSITMNGEYTITASFAKGIWNWYDLDAIRDNLEGNYVLMNDLDSTTAGYEELAGLTANGGKGWKPIGAHDPNDHAGGTGFAGVLDGQRYEIRNLFASRPDEDSVGLFGGVDQGGVVENLGVVDSDVTGGSHVGGLVGDNGGTVRNTYYSGSVTGGWRAAGLVGSNDGGATVSNSWFSGSVTGAMWIDGLVAGNLGIVSNCHYSYDEVLINGKSIITTGALFAEDFQQWLAEDKLLDVNERLAQQDGYYVINSVGDFKELLAFGQDGSLRFRLETDLDLGNDANFYVPYLAGEFDGNGHKIWNLSFRYGFVARVGLFGYVARGGRVGDVSVENVSITGCSDVGGLVGCASWGSTVSNAYSSGVVTGWCDIGGLVGSAFGTLSNSYFRGSVTGHGIGGLGVGGLVGLNGATVANCHYNYDEVLINGGNVITIGALFAGDFHQWLANHKFLDVNDRLSKEAGYYLINDVSDFKHLLAFGQDGSLRFRLQNDLDLGDDPNFFIPYLAGEFDGNGRRVRNLSLGFGFVSNAGLFGYIGSGGEVRDVRAENVSVIGDRQVGGLVGGSSGTVSSSCADGSVTGRLGIGGLVGVNADGAIDNSYSAGSVDGDDHVGGLVGWNVWSTISSSRSVCGVTGRSNVGGLVGMNSHHSSLSRCYSSGSVTGERGVGGLVGANYAAVSGSFWDTETSGLAVSDGGIGKTTTEMKRIATFSGAGWNIVAVGAGQRNTAYIWNMVDGQTYPFLSWQPVT